MANASFSVASLDPDTNKANFITWLQNQPQYSGYNFAGANFNVILDVLSRNSYLEAFYVNMGFNETFLDSAQLRDSVVSRAKESNYCPYSMGSTSTSLDITIQTANLQSFSIPFGTRFNGVNSNGSFVLVTNSNYFETSTTGNYLFSNVAVYEGNYMSEVYAINANIPNQRLKLSNPTIDTSSLQVFVSENGGVSLTPYLNAADIYNINGNSTVYFLQAGKNNTYEVYFGDGVIGHAPLNGSIVQVYYRACSGAEADNITNFSVLDNLGTINGGSVNSIVISGNPTFGGTNAESIESIRFNAPRYVQTQARAATAFDYKTLILKKFPQVGDVNAYKGGVTSTAVLYGTVLLSCVTPAGNPLTQTLKDQIVSFCTDLDLIHPATQIIDPSDLLIDVTSTVHVDFTVTNNNIAFYKQYCSNAINQYSTNNLQKFNQVLRYSKLSDQIQYVDNNAIVSNELNLVLKRALPVTINTNTSIISSFSNPIDNFNSDQFIYNGMTTYITDQVDDNANGVLYSVFLNSTNNVIKSTPIGTINYANGAVTIANLNITQYITGNNFFNIYAVPTNNDIYPANNDIIKIDSQTILINVANN